MKEDKKIARQMVMDELRFMERHARETGGIMMPSDGPFDDLPDFDDQCVMFSIGARNDLTRSEARKLGHGWRGFVHHYPNARVYINLLGYDEDPREIWEIEEAARYVRWWAKYAGIKNVHQTMASPLGPEGAGFLAACGAFGEEMRRCTETPPPTPRN